MAVNVEFESNPDRKTRVWGLLLVPIGLRVCRFPFGDERWEKSLETPVKVHGAGLVYPCAMHSITVSRVFIIRVPEVELTLE